VFYGSLAVVGYLLLQVLLLVSFKVPTNSMVPDDYIVGRVWRIWKSVDGKGKVRWDRIGKKVE
jgi:hypothetical protein